MAPGVEVARVDTDKWSISIHGINGCFANKLQVLIDGRSVYTPLFSGVIWSQQDTFIEDIECIEVIHGPGTTVWDAKLAWKPIRNTEFFVVRQNLFSQSHRESQSDFIPSIPTYIPRGIYAGLEWRF